MPDPADSDSDEFFDASENRPEQDSMAQSVEKRVESLEKQMACLSGQMSTIVDKLETISTMLAPRPSTKPMRACHARKTTRISYGAAKKDVPPAGQPPPPQMAKHEGLESDQTTESPLPQPSDSHDDTEVASDT